ncbi:YcxB family protein [Sediminibacillus sp. JSM 1682029]|uniref:YcxB family protein n=1 Tax=Sediminibacillus sp. JSM 1682029 TaxID=3229857 RepID=UPI0035259DB6
MLLSLGRAPLVNELLLAIVLTLSYFLIFNHVYDKLTLLSIRRVYRGAKQHPMLGSNSVNITDLGVERNTDNFHDYFDWNTFEKISEDDEYFFLYVSDVFVIILKKKSTNLNVEEENYHQYIKEQMRKVNGG